MPTTTIITDPNAPVSLNATEAEPKRLSGVSSPVTVFSGGDGTVIGADKVVKLEPGESIEITGPVLLFGDSRVAVADVAKGP